MQRENRHRAGHRIRQPEDYEAFIPSPLPPDPPLVLDDGILDLLSRADLAAWEEKNGRLPNGCCVAMHSGWGRLATADPARFIGRDVNGTMHFPGVGPDAAEWLLKERQVTGLAVDTLSLDNGPSADFKTHYLWLPSGRWGLENVANLDRVPAAGATLVVGLPKVKDATGAPVRLFALT